MGFSKVQEDPFQKNTPIYIFINIINIFYSCYDIIFHLLIVTHVFKIFNKVAAILGPLEAGVRVELEVVSFKSVVCALLEVPEPL